MLDPSLVVCATTHHSANTRQMAQKRVPEHRSRHVAGKQRCGGAFIAQNIREFQNWTSGTD